MLEMKPTPALAPTPSERLNVKFAGSVWTSACFLCMAFQYMSSAITSRNEPYETYSIGPVKSSTMYEPRNAPGSVASANGTAAGK